MQGQCRRGLEGEQGIGRRCQGRVAVVGIPLGGRAKSLYHVVHEIRHVCAHTAPQRTVTGRNASRRVQTPGPLAECVVPVYLRFIENRK